MCTELADAVRRADDTAFGATYQAIVDRVPRAGAAERTAAVAALGPMLAEVPLSVGADIAVLAGGLMEMGAEPGATLGTLALRVADGLERAGRFAERWRDGTGEEPPDAGDRERIPMVLDRLPPEDHGLAEAWFCVGDWLPGLLVPLQVKAVRRALPHRERLTAAVLQGIAQATWLIGLLHVLDDEPLIVLHRATGRGHLVTISGIGDNFQLNTLLAGTLIGDPSIGLLPGERPEPAWVAAASDGPPEPPGGIRGRFNLVDAFGEWIWNEGRPADIPFLDVHRVVVLDPPPYPRSWNAGRIYPLMRPEITLTRMLSPGEAAHWMTKIAPDARAR